MSNPTTNPTRQQLDELDSLLQRMLSLPINPPDVESAPSPAPVMPPPSYMHTMPPAAPAPSAHFSYSTPIPVPMAPPPPRAMAPPPMPPRPVAAHMRPAPPPPPRRKPEVTPGDQTWNVPLPAGSGASVQSIGTWPVGLEAFSTRVAPPPPAPPPASNLRVTTIPSPDETNQARETPPPMQRLRVEPPSPPPAAPHPIPQVAMPTPTYPAYTFPAEPPIPFTLWPVAAVDWIIGKSLAAALGPAGRWLGQGSGKLLIGWCGVLMLSGAVVWGVMDYMGWRW